jgi:hypothetical protein
MARMRMKIGDRYTLGFGQQTKEMRPLRKLSRRWGDNIKKDIK